MQLTILGGGGFRTPLVYEAIQGAPDLGIDEVVLQDVDTDRLRTIERVLRQIRQGDHGPAVRSARRLDEALDGADFVFSAIRVGGLSGRTADERVALDLGLLGQETTGPGGVAFGLRTVPVAVHIAEQVARIAPEAWVIDFTNPAGMITEAMQSILGDRAIGICDSPVGLARRAARAAGVDIDRATMDYVGLNHLGWLRSLTVDGSDVLPALLADTGRLTTFEEGRLFGAEWLQELGMLPNEYLYYYYFTRDAIASITGADRTRGELLVDQQTAFYDNVSRDPESALTLWRTARRERDASYMQESRAADEARDPDDVEGGGYEGVAIALMNALAHDVATDLVLDVRNGTTIPQLPADSVVEVPCRVGASGPGPRPGAPLTGHAAGLVQQVKEVERLTIRAALEGSPRLAQTALALHPLVDSVTTARQLLEEYRRRIPALDSVFRRS